MSALAPTPRTVLSNLFDVKSLPTVKFHQYEVSFSPEIKIARRRIELINVLQTDVQPSIFTPRALYDGKTILFSQRQLPLAGQGVAFFEIPNTGKTNVRIGLRNVGAGPVDFSGLKMLFAGQAPFNPAMAAEINVLQLILKQVPHQSYVQKGKSFYSPQGGLNLQNGIEIWRGFFQSMRPSPGRMIVNVDISATTFYAAGNLIEHCLQVLGKKNARDLERLQPDELRKLESHLKNVRIRIKNQPPSRIKSIKCLQPEAGYFPFQVDGMDTTVKNYYLEAHRIDLKFPRMVGVNLRPRNSENPTIIPMELCEVVPGQLYKKQLPAHLTDRMVSFTTLKPEDRKAMIMSSTKGKSTESPILQYHASDYLRSAGLAISTEMKQIGGQILSTPKITYANRAIVVPARGGWNVMGKKLFAPLGTERWAVVNFDAQTRDLEVQAFLAELNRCCSDLGMRMAPPRVEMQCNIRAPEKSLENLVSAKFVLVILPKEAAEARAAVKRWGDVMRGIPTQCVRSNKIRNVNNQYCNNVALKINARLGGQNCGVELHPLTQIPGPYMILGIDVSHPGAGVHTRPSIASLVFSTDREALHYQARLCVQPPRTESILEEDLERMVKEAIVIFGRQNKCGPQHIIVYRDGVSEGEYDAVGRREYGIIRQTVAKVGSAIAGKPFHPPKMTFIVVTKRHHVRFFPSTPGDADRSGNCPPGFTTGENLSTPGLNEFYLQSHGGLLGTSRPSHYVVLQDEIFHSRPGSPAGLRLVQSLSYGLCHVYATATRSVSIPAPVYYADRACLRAAKFYFPPEVHFSDPGTDDSGANFDLDFWRRQFGQVQDGHNKCFFL